MTEQLREYLNAKEHFKLAEERKMKAIVALRKSCDHSKVAEAPYDSSIYRDTYDPPKRLCEICGIEEERSCTGWKILTTEYVKHVSRDKLSQLPTP